jgi:hypothetical protein
VHLSDTVLMVHHMQNLWKISSMDQMMSRHYSQSTRLHTLPFEARIHWTRLELFVPMLSENYYLPWTHTHDAVSFMLWTFHCTGGLLD